MKILTITLHSLQNPGSVLQAFGLQHFLQAQGYDTEIIDYRPAYVSTGKKKFRVALGKLLFMASYLRRTKKFNAFLRDYLRLTPKRYPKYKLLVENPPEADVYITGSDQIWNSSYDCGRDEAFYLGFVKKGVKMSYAASIGKEVVPRNEVQWITKHLKDFDFISVREKTSQTLLKSKGIANVSYVCDPVLLVEEAEYRQMARPPVAYGKYVAVYLVDKSPLLDELVAALKERYGYKIVLIGGFSKRCQADFHIKDMGPRDFLGLIAGAEFVIASSFHATVFSHIFRKKFAVILPEGNGARMEQFLEITQLTHRIIRKSDDLENVWQEINYDLVGDLLTSFVNKSKRKLIDAINNTTLKGEAK